MEISIGSEHYPNSRSEWIFGKIGSVFENKERILKSVIMRMLAKTVKTFKYNGLPDTIKAKDLETQLQVGGFAIFKEVDGKLYSFLGGLGGKPNPYYLPTIAVVANPALKYNASLEIDKDCVVMLNDYYYEGVMPLFNRYGELLVEAELSLRNAIYNARVPALIQADNDETYASAKEFFENIKVGKFGIIATKEFFEGIKSTEFYHEAYIKDLIEAIQYIKGSWYNEIGLNAAFNMKREAINEAEATLNEDILYPTIDVMLECRQKGLERVNEMFGTNITVELDSIWAMNEKDDELSEDLKEAEIESLLGENTEESEEDTDDEDVGNADDSTENQPA